MNARLPLLALFVTLAGAAVAQLPLPAPPASAAPAGNPRKADPFERTRKQIEALVGRRVSPPKFDPTRYNPFLLGPLPDAKPPAGSESQPAEVVRPASSDETVLQQLVTRLKVTGSLSREGRTLLVINGVPRGEGDTVALPHEGGTAALRIKSISNGWFVVTYRNAELPLRY